MEGSTNATNGSTKAKTSKGKGKKPASAKPVSATQRQFRERFRAECAAHVEALALLSEAESAVLALIGTDDKKAVFHHLDVVRSCVFGTFPI